jgi:hypothetical protein
LEYSQGRGSEGLVFEGMQGEKVMNQDDGTDLSFGPSQASAGKTVQAAMLLEVSEGQFDGLGAETVWSSSC